MLVMAEPKILCIATRRVLQRYPDGAFRVRKKLRVNREALRAYLREEKVPLAFASRFINWFGE